MDTCVTETRAHCEAAREAEDDLTLGHATKRGSVASPPTRPAVLSASAMRNSSAVVAPKLATSRPLLSRVGAHTQCRSLPKSMPATFHRMIGKLASCLRLFSVLAISSLPGIS